MEKIVFTNKNGKMLVAKLIEFTKDKKFKFFNHKDIAKPFDTPESQTLEIKLCEGSDKIEIFGKEQVCCFYIWDEDVVVFNGDILVISSSDGAPVITFFPNIQ